MKRTGIYNMVKKIPVYLLLALMIPSLSYATGPRVTGTLFSTDKGEIYAVDTAPFISMEVKNGGVTTEVVNSALAMADLDLVVTTLPLQRMVSYYLLQENAIAVMGSHFNFGQEKKKHLIFIPITVSSKQYYYYKGSYPDGLSRDLKKLNGKRYGARYGEDVSVYKKAGINVIYGRSMSLLKKLKNAEIDFVGMPKASVDWLVKSYLPQEKGNFIAMDKSAGNEVLFLIINKKHPDSKATADTFKKALANMLENGQYLEILQRHMNHQQADGYLQRLQNY